MTDALTGLGKVNASKVDFNYAINDLSEVSYIEIGNDIRKFAVQKAPYYIILSEIAELGKVERQKKMAAKFKPDLNFYCLSPEFDYKQPVYLLSCPDHQRIKVHGIGLEDSMDAIIREASELQQLIIQAGDIDIESYADNTFRTEISATTFGIGPKGGAAVISLDTGNPQQFIISLVNLFKLSKSAKIARGAGGTILIKKYLPNFMQKMD